MKVSVNAVGGLAVSVGLLAGCTEERGGALPTAPAVVDVAGAVQAQGVPRAVFRTTPPDIAGTIGGPSPLSVEFNLCQTRPESEDDDLKFTYDFDGDGAVDEFGHCRATHVYENGGRARSCTPARVCVSDRRPGNEVCRSYEVCAEGTAPTGPAPIPVFPEVEPNDDGVPDAGGWGGPGIGNDFSAAGGNSLTVTGPSIVTGLIAPGGDEDYFRVANPGPNRITMIVRLYSASGPPACPRGALSALNTAGVSRVYGYGTCVALGFDLDPGGAGYIGALSIDDGTDPALASYPYQIHFEVLPSQGYGRL